MRRFISLLLVFLMVADSFGAFSVRVTNGSTTCSLYYRVYRDGVMSHQNILGPGATYLHSSALFTNGVSITIQGGASYDEHLIGAFTGPATGTVTNIGYCDVPPAETNCLYQFPILNNNASVQTFYAARSLVIDMTKTLVLAPGQSGVLSFNAPCVDSNLWTILWAPYGEPEDLDIGGQITPVDESPGDLTPTIVDNPAPSAYDPYSPSSGYGTNGPIDFSGPLDTDQEGFSALYDVLSKFAAQNNQDLRNLLEASEGSSSPTILVSNYSNFSTNVHDQGTHDRLDVLLGSLTNAFDDLTGYTNFTEIGEINDPLHDGLAGLLGGTMDTTVPSGSGSAWKVKLYPDGPDFDFRPSSYFGDVFAMAKQLFTWLLIFSYFTKVLIDLSDLLKTVFYAQQLKVPDMQVAIAGTGANFRKLLVPFFVGALLILYAALLAGAMTGVASIITGTTIGTFFQGPFAGLGGMVAEGIAESALFFPWVFFIGLAGAYVIWLATKNFVAAGFGVAFRLLVS